MNKEMKKCPFCGGEAVFRTKSNSSSIESVGFRFEIICGDCGAKLPQNYKVEFCLANDGGITPLQDERKQAIVDWNRRVYPKSS